MHHPTAVPLSQATREYLAAKRVEGYSPHTLSAYELHLRKLTEAIGDLPVREVTLDHFRRHLATLGHLKATSVGLRIAVYRSCFKWLHEEGIVLTNPTVKLKEPKTPKRVPKALSIEEVELLRDACTTLRDHALLETFFATGARIGELATLNRDQVDWTRNAIVVFGKGAREREVYLGARAAIWLRRYVQSRTDAEPALFVTVRSFDGQPRRLTIQSLRHTIDVVADRAGLGHKVTPHVLRHTLATVLLNQGAPLATVQSILGHQKPETTLLYTHLSGAARERDFRRYFVQ